MLRIRPSLTTAKSVPLIGLSAPSGPMPQEKRTWSPKPLGSPISLKRKSGKRCCTPAIKASTPSWPSPDISGSTYFASSAQCCLRISRRRLGVRHVERHHAREYRAPGQAGAKHVGVGDAVLKTQNYGLSSGLAGDQAGEHAADNDHVCVRHC